MKTTKCPECNVDMQALANVDFVQKYVCLKCSEVYAIDTITWLSSIADNVEHKLALWGSFKDGKLVKYEVPSRVAKWKKHE